MAIFISYSHEDREFVDLLAAHLVKARAQVWVDRWELKVGDSILGRVQDAIAGASALLVVLSPASVASEWCKKELTSGLLRELEEKRVVVLPVLLADCPIPLFLRDKLYADFRSDFDEGLEQILRSVAGVTSDTQGRVTTTEYHSDWAIDWDYHSGRLQLHLTIVEQAKNAPFTVLSEITIEANKAATRRYRQYESAGLPWFGRQVVLEMLADMSGPDLFMILEDQFPKTKRVGSLDPRSGLRYDVRIKCRRLGEDSGNDVVVDLKGVIQTIRSANEATLRRPSEEEQKRLLAIVAAPPRA